MKLKNQIFYFGAFLCISTILTLGACAKTDKKQQEEQTAKTKIPPPPPPPIANVPALSQRTKADLIKQIHEEYKELLYIRAVARYQDEITYVVDERQRLREGLVKEDAMVPYWTASSAVREGLKMPLYDASRAKTGLVLSNKAKLGVFSPFDLGTVTKNKKAAVNLSPAVSPLTKELFAPGQERYARNLSTVAEVKDFLKKMANGLIPYPRFYAGALRAQGKLAYNEALIFYTEEDILGIWAADSTDDNEAIAFQKAMTDKFGVDLPLVYYRLLNNNAPGAYSLADYVVEFSVK